MDLEDRTVESSRQFLDGETRGVESPGATDWAAVIAKIAQGLACKTTGLAPPRYVCHAHIITNLDVKKARSTPDRNQIKLRPFDAAYHTLHLGTQDWLPGWTEQGFRMIQYPAYR